MTKVSIKKARKLGFWTALSISVSAVIGIGIFFKNISVINSQTISGTNSFAFWSFISVWILGALISLFTAYSFSEIASSKRSKSGMAGWIEKLAGSKKQGTWLKILQPGFYNSILGVAMPVFAMESIFLGIYTASGKTLDPSVYPWIIISAIVLFIALLVFNYFSLKWSAKVQIFSLFFKVISLVVAIVIGFIGVNYLGKTGNEPGIKYGIINGSSSFLFSGFFIALPAVLFSFDSFLSIGALEKNTKNKNVVPLASIFTIVIAGVIYILISLGAAFKGTGFIGNIFQTIIPAGHEKDSQALASTIWFIVGLGAWFVTNSVSIILIKSNEGLIEDKCIFGYKFFEKLDKKRKDLGALVLSFIFIGFYSIVLLLPSLITNNDQILDSVTNLPTIVWFFLYAYAMILGLINRKTNKVQVRKVKGFIPSSIIAIILILGIMSFQFIYKNIYIVILDKDAISSSGLFVSTGTFTVTIDALVTWILLAWIIFLSAMNYHLVKKQWKKDQLVVDPYDLKLVPKNKINLRTWNI
ncbi:APC family permease [Mycoplasmopsis sturni]|uniref:APC family permease n=1 Tax=Mycoplasmopsis sturni TaxID=39047 RepID=UPI00068CBAD4|nr:APC family permease [Mycoplasmopsis sturni]